MSRISFVTVAVILVSFYDIGCNTVHAEENLAKPMLDNLISMRCTNSEYLKCLGINERQCNELSVEAFDSCPLKYMDSFDAKILDSVCNAEQFVVLSGISPKVFKECGKYLQKDIDSIRKDIDSIKKESSKDG